VFQGNVLSIRQPSIAGFCVDVVKGHCAELGATAAAASIAS
jgi:hypothetical protein